MGQKGGTKMQKARRERGNERGTEKGDREDSHKTHTAECMMNQFYYLTFPEM